MNLQAIREQRAGHVAEMRAMLAKAEGEKRSLSADEQAKFDALKASIEKAEADEARASFLVKAERRMMGTPAGGGDRSFSDLQSRVSVVDVIRAQMEGRSLDGAAREQVIALVGDLVAKGKSLLMICHDRDLIALPGITRWKLSEGRLTVRAPQAKADEEPAGRA